MESSFIQHKQKACVNKTVYYKQNEAELAARIMYLQNYEDFVAYLCQFCKKWHVGHNTK